MKQVLGRYLPYLNPIRIIRRVLFVIGNRRRRFRKVEYIIITIPPSMSAFSQKRGWLRRRILGEAPMSLFELERLLRRIASDPRSQGVVFHLRDLQMRPGDLQTMRAYILRLRADGKRAIAYSQNYNNLNYYIASACDEIILQPGGQLNTIGLLAQPVFLRDALAQLGVMLDAVAITPYKSAFDPFTRDSISPQAREQLDWLLDSSYETWSEHIAAGRKITPAAVQEMVDSAPHLDHAALDAGYIDALLNEEHLATHLGAKHLLSRERAEQALYKQWPKTQRRYVALLPISGLIVSGESATPPWRGRLPIPFVGEARAGDLTIVQQARALLNNKSVAAVVLFVDSPGGSALASEAMRAALAELAKTRPLVAYMHNVAASGGYYVSTAAQWIVAQPGTISGSIGVLAGKAVTQELWDKLRANRIEFTRGANATIYSDAAPFSDAQREQMRRSIEGTYEQFLDHVGHNRNMERAAMEALAGGRVWTGAQAKDHGLVDELGGLQTALEKARELAKLPDDVPLVLLRGKDKPLAPQLAEQSNPAAILRYINNNLNAIASGSAQMLLPFWWAE